MFAPVLERRVPNRQLRVLQGLYLSQTSAVTLLRIVAYSWFLEELSSDRLPWVYLLQALPLCLLPLLFGVVDRVGRAWLVAAISASVAAGVALFYLGASLGLEPLAPLFVVLAETAISAFGSSFWTLASDLLSPEQARRHFPSLALVGALGAILAGGIAQLAPMLPPRGLLPFLLVPLAASGLLAWCVQRWYPYRVGPRRSPGPLSWLEEMREGVQLLRHSRLLFWIGLLTTSITALGLVSEYLYMVAAEQGQPVARLTVFFGGIHVIVNVLQLLLVLLLGPRIFTTFGLVRTIGSYPAGSLLLVLVGLSSGSAWPLIALKVFDRLENYLILNPGVGIALNAFPRTRRGRASLVFSGLLKPVAIAVTGLVLVLLGSQPRALLVLAVLGFLAFFPILHQLRLVYRSSLVNNLRSSDARLVSSSIEALAEPEHRVVVPTLLEFLEKTDEPVFQENVLLAAGQIGDARFVPALLKALHGPNRSLKAAAARSLARFPTAEVREALLRALREEDSARVKASILSALGHREHRPSLYPVLREGLADPEPRVRANAVEAVGLTRDPALVAELLPFLHDRAPRVMANAVVALAQLPATRTAALAVLRETLLRREPGTYLSALYAAGEVRDESLLSVVRRAAADSDPDVRRNAILALGKCDAPEAVSLLERMLVGPAEQARVVALVLDRLGPNVREALLERLSRSPPEERDAAIRALKSCGINYPQELEQLEALPPPSRALVLDTAALSS